MKSIIPDTKLAIKNSMTIYVIIRSIIKDINMISQINRDIYLNENFYLIKISKRPPNNTSST